MTDGLFWTVEDVANHYGVSRRLIYYAVQKGSLPAIRVEGVLRIRKEDALEFGRPVHDVHAAHGFPQASTTS